MFLYWRRAISSRQLVINPVKPSRFLAQLTSTDTAFLDRADIVQYIDVPPPEAIYDILRSCLQELMRRGLIPELVRLSYSDILFNLLINFRIYPTLKLQETSTESAQ